MELYQYCHLKAIRKVFLKGTWEENVIKHFCINRGYYSIITPRHQASLKRYETGVEVVGQWRGRAETNTESTFGCWGTSHAVPTSSTNKQCDNIIKIIVGYCSQCGDVGGALQKFDKLLN